MSFECDGGTRPCEGRRIGPTPILDTVSAPYPQVEVIMSDGTSVRCWEIEGNAWLPVECGVERLREFVERRLGLPYGLGIGSTKPD